MLNPVLRISSVRVLLVAATTLAMRRCAFSALSAVGSVDLLYASYVVAVFGDGAGQTKRKTSMLDVLN